MALFMPFDNVQYAGEKLRSELRGKLGSICARVNGSDNTYVVDFGDGAYVMHESLLERFKPNTKEDMQKAEAEIYRRRKPKNNDE